MIFLPNARKLHLSNPKNRTEILRVPDLKEKCLEQCEIAQLECILACDNDVNCISDCIRHATDCIEGC